MGMNSRLVSVIAVAALVAEGTAEARARCVGPGSRVQCGRSGNGVQPLEVETKERCEQRGCCFDPVDSTCHMQWVGDAANVTTVHLIQSNHFDAGYTDHIEGVLNKYFTVYFPRAVSLGKSLREGKSPYRLRWMTQSYIVSLYLDCPGGLGLQCPTDTEKSAFEDAVREGDIVWHAFPQNAEMMMNDQNLLRFGINMTRDIDSRLGTWAKQVVSLRDVPGFERSVIPVFADMNVTMLSEGMNGRIYPVNVPPAFVWRDGGVNSTTDATSTKRRPVGVPSQKEILAIWHPKGYGGLGDYVTLPGFSHALAYDWRGDNQGPPTSESDVESTYKRVQKDFPGAVVKASSLEEFAAELVKVKEQLPIVEAEVGDSWIWGVGSDPVKTAQLRSMQRELSASGPSTDPAIFNMSRLFTKGSEHTWGISYGNFGIYAKTHWSNEEFHQDRKLKFKYVTNFERAWQTQKEFAVGAPLSALNASGPGRALAERISSDFNAMTPERLDPQSEGFTRAPSLDSVLANLGGWCDLGFNVSTGAVNTLVDNAGGGAVWASEGSPLLLQRYQTLTEVDYNNWGKEYLIQQCPTEYGKPGQDSGKWSSEHQLVAPGLQELWYKNASGGATEVLARVVFASDLNQLYGSAAEAWVRLSLRQETTLVNRGIDIKISFLNKTTTRLGEAMFVTFKPPGAGEGE
eukprot:Hpha_TRINITY_DN23386_c0_g1::TRINITY_DN23386_c0_g1_i1::g.96862::m.96862